MSDEHEQYSGTLDARVTPDAARPFVPLSVGRVRDLLGNRYDVVRELGAGGMAVVYLAHDRELDRDVAVKVLRPELSAAVLAARFLREIRIGQRLVHENVLTIHESGIADGELYYTMPYVAGETLQQRLARETQLSIEETVRIARGVANALDHAHALGVIHRDIKPANILLEGDRVIVTDFGIARAMSEAATTPLTDSGLVIGTAPYMSPEQGGAERQLDGRSDVYSLACVVYEMLGGEPPFTGPTARAIIARHYHEEPRSLRIIRPTVTTGMQRAIEKGLAKVAEDRFATAGALVDAVEAGAGEPDSMATTLAEAVRRRSTTFALSAVAVIALVAAGWALRSRRASLAGASTNGPPVLAIRPFRDATASTGLGWLAAALETRLADALVEAPDLALRSTTAVAAYASRQIPDDSLARLLDVDYFLDGRIVPSGDSVGVTVQLSDAKKGTVLETGTIRQPLRTSSEQLLEAVSSKVALTLLPAIGRQVRVRQWKSASQDTLAVLLRHRAQERRWAGEALIDGDPREAERQFAESDSLLAASLRRDPQWSEPRLARADMAARRALAARRVSDTAAVRRILDDGIASADAVLREDPASADGMAHRGRLRWRKYLWAPQANRGSLLDSAEADLRIAATARKPVAAAAQDLSEILYMVRSRFAEAREFALRAYRLDSYLDETGLLINRLALTSLNVGDDVGAANWCRTGLRRYPDQLQHIACVLEVMAWGNQGASPDSAMRLYQALISHDSTSNVRRHYLVRVAAVYARSGRKAEAERLLAQVRQEMGEAGPDRQRLLPWEAGVYFRMGNNEEGNRLFERYRAASPNDAAVRATGYPLRGYVVLR